MAEKKKSFTRYTVLSIVLVIVFTIIISRLVYLQVVQAQDYKDQANKKSVTEIQDTAPRGEITDCNGKVLASNTQTYVLQYIETPDNEKYYYNTIDTVYKILTENNQTMKDDFALKVNPYRFEFKVQEDDPTKAAEARDAMEIRFLKDRGFDDDVIKKIFSKKDAEGMIREKDKISSANMAKINKALLKITPKQVFNKLLKTYEINKFVNKSKGRKFTLEELRRYMVVKDAAKMQSFSGFKPVVVAQDISRDTAFIFLQKLSDLPGMDVSTQPSRVYPFGDLGSNFLGYVSKIQAASKEKKENYEEQGYDVNTDYIGTSGLEYSLEDRLRGSKGARVVKLNKNGTIIEELGKREPYPGQNIQLTINANVQNAAQKALQSTMQELQAAGQQKDVNTTNATRGAVVVENVNTGGIIAMVSEPSFDPNLMVKPGGLSQDLYKQYFSPDLAAFGHDYVTKRGLQIYFPGKSVDEIVDILFPIDTSIPGNTTIRQDRYDIYPKATFNYATQSINPPGSTFKPLTAIAGLETGVITTSTTVEDNATFDDGHGFQDKFPSDAPNGTVALTKAIGASSNPYFMTVGQKLRETFKNDDVLAQYAWKFGLGYDPSSSTQKSTGIEISERRGQVFNTQTNKAIVAQQCIWEIMDTLKKGKSSSGTSFPVIDLYTHDDDDDVIRDLKSEFKNQVMSEVKAISSSDQKDEEILRKLISADDTYKDKKISDRDIKIIIKTISNIKATYTEKLSFKYGYNMYTAAIGQGLDNFSPLELVNYVSTIVNGGKRYKVHLVDKYMSPEGKVLEQVKPEVLENTGIKSSTLEAVKQGMLAVTNAAEGTARAAFEGFPIPNAGKTGSATYNENYQQNYGRTSFAEYIGFAPYDNPEIAVDVVVFDGGYGGNVAKIARAVFEEYFKDELKKQYPDYKPMFNYDSN